MVLDIKYVIDCKTAIRDDLKYYPYWGLHLIKKNRDCEELIIYPSFEEMKTMIKIALKHERQVDFIVGRRNEYSKWKSFLKDCLDEAQSYSLNDFSNIPKEILDCKKGVEE